MRRLTKNFFKKEFDFLLHSLMIENIYAYGFDKTSTEYLKDLNEFWAQKIKNEQDV